MFSPPFSRAMFHTAGDGFSIERPRLPRLRVSLVFSLVELPWEGGFLSLMVRD